MRLFSVLFFSLFCINAFAQKAENDYQVTYQHYYDTKYPTIIPAVLYVRNDITIYKTMVGQSDEWKEGKDQSHMRPTGSSTKVIKDDYLKIDHNKKTLLTFGNLSGDVLIEDNYPELNWVLTSDKKSIAGHQCIKASTNYRGRDWEAWFAPDIALPYGPWKLHGLPGLILEANSTDMIYIMRAVTIEKSQDAIFDADFKKLRAPRNNNPITYKQFLADLDESFDNMGKKMESEGMTVIIETPPRTGYELKYEWEK